MINTHYGERDEQTISDVLQEWREWLVTRREYDYSTADNYSYVIGKIAADCEVSLFYATTLDLREVLCRYYEDITPTTCNMYRSILIAFYNFLRYLSIRKDNPAKDIPRRKTTTRIPKWLGTETINKILSTQFDESNPKQCQQRVIINLMLLCGLSCKQIANLSANDIKFDRESQSWYITSSTSMICVSHETFMAIGIADWLNKCLYTPFNLFPDYTSPATIKHMVRYIMCEQCGVYGVSSRTLRTTFAISMINAGVRDYFVAKMLGTKTLDAAYLQLKNNISFLSAKYKACFHRTE